MRVVGWHFLSYEEECESEINCGHRASVVVMLDDEISTENRCECCLPPNTPDPILDVFADVLRDTNREW